MTRLPAILLLLITLVLAISVLVQGEEEPNDPAQKQSYWMKKKLEWSQAILRDLATGDWEKMRQNARSLRTLSKIEGRFRRVDQEEYRAQLAVFDQANSELLQAAEKENIDRATLAY